MKVVLDNGTFAARYKKILNNPGEGGRPQVFYTNYYNIICLYYVFQGITHKTVVSPNEDNQDAVDLYLAIFGEVLYAEDIEVY
jgi:hypothetical protein